MLLLNHAGDVLHTPAYERQCHCGSEVKHVLFLVWHAANRIFSRRLMPFLPILIEALEGLSLTDRAIGWTECLPLLHRREVPRFPAI